MINIFNSRCQQTRVEHIVFTSVPSSCYIYYCKNFEDKVFLPLLMVVWRVCDLAIYACNPLKRRGNFGPSQCNE